MWIEITDNEGKTLGAVNSDACDLIRVSNDGPERGAMIRNVQTSEVYKTKISYLRLIEAITQSEASGLKQLAEAVKVAEEADKPRLVLG
jgi:hypothetical protein